MKISKRKLKTIIENFIREQDDSAEMDRPKGIGEITRLNDSQVRAAKSAVSSLEADLSQQSIIDPEMNEAVLGPELLYLVNFVIALTAPEDKGHLFGGMSNAPQNYNRENKDDAYTQATEAVKQLHYDITKGGGFPSLEGEVQIEVAEDYNLAINNFIQAAGNDTGLLNEFGKPIFNELEKLKFQISRESLSGGMTSKLPSVADGSTFEAVAKELVDGAYYVKYGE